MNGEEIQYLQGENASLRKRLQAAQGIILRQEGQLARDNLALREAVLALSLARQWLLNIQRHIAGSVLMQSVNPNPDSLSFDSLADALDIALREWRQ